MMKAVLMLTAAAAALLVAQRALATRRTQREYGETKGEIKRWEDEGGNSALHASGMDDTFGP
jgi:hypothetical protein